MSVQSQIDRLAAAKAAIKTVIEGKGVTVPDATALDGFAALIEAIEAGGGIKVAAGTITPTDMNASQLDITHGLGVMPDVIFICASSEENGVYSASMPKGQSFIYAINSGRKYGATNYNGYLSRMQYSDASNYVTGGVYGDQLGTWLQYYIACNEQKIIWANRNSKYGFGTKSAPFFWAVLEGVLA